MKKRIGKDFDAVISVQHDGEPINFSQYEVLWVSIDTAYRRTKLKPGTWTTAGGLITAHISRNLISSAGEHWFTVAYRKPDASIEDGYYDFEDNSESFQIVGKTEDEDAGDLTAKVELLAGLTGKAFKYEDFTPEQLESLKVKGDPFRYEDFTPDQIAELQQPASDIATSVSNAEGLRVTAETNRNNAEGLRLSAEIIRNENEADRIEAEGLRVGAEISRQTAEGLRQLAENNRQTNTATAISNAENATEDANEAAILANEKAGLANNAALLANEKAELAATATTQANTARDGANSAAQAANEAATNISPEVINNEQVQAETYNVLNARISALESLIANGIFTYLQADTLIGVNSMLYKGAEFFLYGTAAPSIAPDFIGQFYINTTAGTTYQAKGIVGVHDWKQTSN